MAGNDRPLTAVGCEEKLELSWSHWIRQGHRWISVAFVVAVIVDIVAQMQGQAAVWIGLLALIPLVLLLLTGLYLFALPYTAARRAGRIG